MTNQCRDNFHSIWYFATDALRVSGRRARLLPNYIVYNIKSIQISANKGIVWKSLMVRKRK